MVSVNLNKLPVKRISIAALSVACMILTVVGITISTHNDGPQADNGSAGRIVTRTVIDNRGFFSSTMPNSSLMLAWQDNTIKLDENGSSTVKLGAVLYPMTMPDTSLSFTSSNESVATVSEDGTITAAAPGSTEITVENYYTGEKAKAFLQVVQPVTGFVLNKTTITIYTTDKGIRLEGEVFPSNASNTALQWYSKDSSIVEVDNTGHIKPVNIGMTEVVASTTDGGFKSKCFVNVIQEIIKAQTVTIQNKDNINLQVGEKWDGVVSVLPSNARNRSVEWKSDNEDIATVSKTGTVRALAEGKVKITAESSDGPSDSVEITVSGKSSSTSEINLNYSTYAAAGGVTYTKYDMTLDVMVDKQMAANPPPKFNGAWATREKAKEYIDPNEFCAGAYKYQFMDLSHYNGLSRSAIESFLDGKGTLSGQADAFIEAAKEYNVSELYLIAHACLETGYGTSQLASGVNVNGVTVYNMYGINAYDGSVVYSGSRRAYAEGWTSPAAAIKGGAKWISENYINSDENRQNTLYKMRWNPENPGIHLYAGDCAWATTQAVIMERLFKEFPGASIAYEIPVYEGSNAAVIDENIG